MCQAYEEEARFYISMGSSVARIGWEDKINGKPMKYKGSLWKEDYEHGYACAEQGILPHGVERDLGLDEYGAIYECPACGAKVKRHSKEHKFGFPCDGSNPFDHQRKAWRRKQYEELKKEFGD